MSRLHVLSTLVLFAVACAPQLDVGGPCAPYNSGEAPCKQQFYFPTGLTVDPDGDVLYVVSSNADLRYSGGALTAIDLQLAECAIAFARNGYDVAKLPKGCAGRTRYGATTPFDYASLLTPVSTCSNDANCPRGWICANGYCTNEPAGVHTHFGCLASPLDPNIVECDETPLVIDAVKIGNFGGSVKVQQRVTGAGTVFPAVDESCPFGSTPAARAASPSCDPASTPDGGVGDGGTFCCVSEACTLPSDHDTPVSPACFNRRLWLPVRGDPSLTFVHALKGPDSVRLSCFDPSNKDPAQQLDGCGNQRISVRDFHRNQVGVPTQIVPLPPEPFSISIDEGRRADNTPYSHLVVTHLSGIIVAGQDGRDIGGEVTLINSGVFNPTSTDSLHPTEQVVLDVKRNFFAADSIGRHGTYAVAPRTPGDATGYWYMTSRINPTVATFRISDEDLILPGAGFAVNGGVFLAGDDIRDMIFEPGGNRAFFVEGHPPSVFTLDTRIDPVQPPAGVPRNFIIDAIGVCQGPSHLGMQQYDEVTSTGTRRQTRLYVVCFTTGQVMVVDPDNRLIVDTVSVGLGANDIAFNFGPGFSGALAGLPRRGYVTNYVDMSISILDLEVGSPTENRVIGRIGLTAPPVSGQ